MGLKMTAIINLVGTESIFEAFWSSFFTEIRKNLIVRSHHIAAIT